jgi:hypothetical protein
VAPDTLTERQLNRATLARQLLLAREPLGAAEAIGRLFGLQAQEAKPPFLGLWSRLEGFRREDLRAALGERHVVRATLMRATLHLLGADDYAAFRPALQPVMERAARGALRNRSAGLEIDRVLPAARRLLSERPRPFTELRSLLQEQFPEVDDRALGYTVRTHLPLVMVPADARWAFPSVASFTLADEWLGRSLPGSGTPAELVLRYLAAFGPATAADAQTWSGLQGLAAVFASLRSQLAVFRNERGREVFDLPGAPRPAGDVPVPARLLPEFDNLVLAHADRTRLLADEHRGALVTKNLRVRASFLVDGMVAGTWELERKRAAATLRMTPFRALPKRAVEELTAEAEGLLRFAEDDATTFDVHVSSPP